VGYESPGGDPMGSTGKERSRTPSHILDLPGSRQTPWCASRSAYARRKYHGRSRSQRVVVEGFALDSGNFVAVIAFDSLEDVTGLLVALVLTGIHFFVGIASSNVSLMPVP
jgi:hypothetical protein